MAKLQGRGAWGGEGGGYRVEYRVFIYNIV